MVENQRLHVKSMEIPREASSNRVIKKDKGGEDIKLEIEVSDGDIRSEG